MRVHTTLPLGLALLLSVSPASAVESLTGTWEGTLKCETLDSGIVTRTKEPATVEIVDSGVGGVQLELVSTDLVFVGFVVAESAKPDRGVLSTASCSFGPANLDGGTLQADLRTKVGSEKAKLTARLTIMGAVQDLAQSCTLKAKRVGTTEPTILGCAM